jgi:sugar phosphate permease
VNAAPDSSQRPRGLAWGAWEMAILAGKLLLFLLMVGLLLWDPWPAAMLISALCVLGMLSPRRP